MFRVQVRVRLRVSVKARVRVRVRARVRVRVGGQCSALGARLYLSSAKRSIAEVWKADVTCTLKRCLLASSMRDLVRVRVKG